MTYRVASSQYFSSSSLRKRLNLRPGAKLMAIDAYLQIDGIKGESQDSAHQGWIESVLGNMLTLV